MRMNSLGDLGRSLATSQAYARTKSRLDVLTDETATQQRGDIAASMRGDTRPLASIDSRLARLDGFDQATLEMTGRLATVQTSASGLLRLAKGQGPALMGASGADSTLDPLLNAAEGNLNDALGYLNAETGGVYVLSGSATSSPAVIGREALMAQIASQIAGLTTADAVTAAITAYFDAPAGGGGFLDQAYRGSPDGNGPVMIGHGGFATVPVRASDPAFRNMIKGLTLAAVAQQGITGAAEGERRTLVQAAGRTIAAAEGDIIAVSSRVGAEQMRVEAAAAASSAERSALGIARNGIVAVDPYETASALVEAQSRLDALYALTARLSRLSLAERL